MKTTLVLICLSTILSLNLQSKQPVDTTNLCSFQYALSDSLMIYGFDGYELFTTSDCRDDSVYHKWNLSNGLESDERDPNFIINASDSVVEVCHKLVNNSGIVCQECKIITRQEPLPVSCNASFYFWLDSTDNSLGTYQFYDLSVGNIASWKWFFGNEDTSELQNPIYKFSKPGNYEIVLEITSSDGCSSKSTQNLYVRENNDCPVIIDYQVLEMYPPQYRFMPASSVLRNIPGYAPTHADSSWLETIQCFWDFGDGNYSMETFPHHVYKTSGEYLISLEVRFEDGFKCNVYRKDYFEGFNKVSGCDYLGTFYRNYKNAKVDVILNENGEKYFVVKLIPKILLPDMARINFSNAGTGDTIYIEGDIYRGIIVTCVGLVDNSCNLTGTVKDYTGIDGCGYLIKLDNGIRLEPAIIHDSIKFYNNQRVKLSYIDRKDIGSVCMAGIVAEITCIKEIKPDTVIIPPPFCEQIMLNTSFVMNGTYCNGSAGVEVVAPCSAWKYYEMIHNTNYKIIWSTGETTSTISGLCPGTLYFVYVTNPLTGNTYTAAFSIFQVNNIFPSWNFTQNENNYHFYLPVDTGYSVTWKFDDGISLNGNSASYIFNSSGNHQVELMVKDLSDNLIYSEMIQLDVPVGIFEPSNKGIEIFPNPVTDFLNIKIPDNINANITFKLFNYSGQLINVSNFSALNDNVISLDMSALSHGLYLLIINDEDVLYPVKFEKQ